MSSNMRFSAYFDFFFNAVQTGGGPQTIIQNYIDQSTTINQQFNKAAQGAQNAGSSLRRLALDFRLVSGSVRTVVRELGLEETAVGRVASVIQIVGAAMTGLISAGNVYTRMTTSATGATILFSAGLKTLAASATAAIIPLLPFLGLLALIAVAIYVLYRAFEYSTGIESYKNQIKELNDELETLEDQLKAVRLEQSALNAETSALTAEKAALKAQLDSGLITQEAYEQSIAAIERQETLLSAETANLSRDQAILQNEVDQNKAAEEQYTKAIEDRRAAAIFQGGFRPMGMPPMEQREFQSPSGSGGIVNLIVNFAGAQIYGEAGFRDAMSGAVQEQQKELELEFMRRTRVNVDGQ